MRNVWTIIKKEFSRFFKDKRMVFTVILPGLMIFLVYSLMGTVMENVGKTDDDYKFTAYVTEMPENLAAAFGNGFELKEYSDAEAAKADVEAGNLDLAIFFPENFGQTLSGDVKIFYNSSKDNSNNGFITVSGHLNSLINPPFTINAADGVKFDLAGEKEWTGKMLATFMPMLMFALLASGCVAVAPEAIAGEKERGTMATMLITPIKRWQLALGKILSLACFALLSGLSSFIGVILSLPKLMGGAIDGEVATFYSAGDYFMVLGLIISVVLVIISAFSIMSTFAKSVKEAGTLITPIMIIVILLGVFAMFGSSTSTWLYAIPLMGSGLAMSAIMTFTITPLAFVLAIASNFVLAALLITAISFMFKSEKIMFNR